MTPDAQPETPTTRHSCNRGLGVHDAIDEDAPEIVSERSAQLPFAAHTSLSPVAVATVLVMASQFVAGFAVGSSLRLPVSTGQMAIRFTRDPLVALVMGALAMAFTFLLLWGALATRRMLLGVFLCLLGGTLAGGANGFLSLTLLSVARSSLDFATVLATARRSLIGGFAMIPPGLLWGLGSAGVVAALGRSGAREAHDGIHRAAWAGGLCLVASSEAGAILFGEATLTRIVASLGLLAGLGCVGWALAIERLRVQWLESVAAGATSGWKLATPESRANRPPSFLSSVDVGPEDGVLESPAGAPVASVLLDPKARRRAVRTNVVYTLLILLLIQAWVGALYAYWRA